MRSNFKEKRLQLNRDKYLFGTFIKDFGENLPDTIFAYFLPNSMHIEIKSNQDLHLIRKELKKRGCELGEIYSIEAATSFRLDMIEDDIVSIVYVTNYLYRYLRKDNALYIRVNYYMAVEDLPESLKKEGCGLKEVTTEHKERIYSCNL